MNRFAHYPSLEGRTVFISGGTTGIGTAFVEHFHAQGAKVGFIGRNREAADALLAGIAAGPNPHGAPTPLFIPCDVTDVAALQAAIAQTRSAFGLVGALVNNAANDQRHRVEEVTPEFWDQCMNVNLRHQFFAAQAVVDDMVGLGGGSIINLGSISWMIKGAGYPAYATTKAAIHGLTRSLAKDLGKRNIRVNALVPGAIAAGGFVADPALSRHIPLGRLGNADDLAPLALAVLSNRISGYVTGASIVIDGGLALTNWFDPPQLDD